MDKHEELVKKYPKLFEHAWPSVGEGWLPLLDTLCSRIEQYYKWKEQAGVKIVEDGEEPPEEGKWISRFFWAQIKEKFGGLRAYGYGGDDYIRGLVDFAEAHSYRVCEECGNAGEEKPTNWIRTLCDDCYESWEAIRQAKWKKQEEDFMDDCLDDLLEETSESEKENVYRSRIEEIEDHSIGKDDFFIRIPDELLEELGWEVGDDIQIEDTEICEPWGEHQGLIFTNLTKNPDARLETNENNKS